MNGAAITFSSNSRRVAQSLLGQMRARGGTS
jgi:hypothetical protein